MSEKARMWRPGWISYGSIIHSNGLMTWPSEFVGGHSGRVPGEDVMYLKLLGCAPQTISKHKFRKTERKKRPFDFYLFYLFKS